MRVSFSEGVPILSGHRWAATLMINRKLKPWRVPDGHVWFGIKTWFEEVEDLGLVKRWTLSMILVGCIVTWRIG